MRGKEILRQFGVPLCRITPAYAGKSPQSLYDAAQERDHPRLCGEKFTHLRAFFHFVGSPPPMRGKAAKISVDGYVTWITPAYAGKSCQPATAGKRRQDHPRLCGEKV